MADQVLSNVIGAPFPEHVLTQLNIRAARNSTGQRNFQTRSDEEILFLANKMAWVKLTSSVTIVPPPGVQSLQSFYESLGIPGGYSSPDDLRKSWILEAGTSTSDGTAGINLRKGIGPEGAYGLGGTEELGYRPMPGLTSVTVDTVGTLGSLRQANINFKVWNMNQLNTIEALYFRLGYSMILEWGHAQFFTNASQGTNLGGTFNTNTYGIDPFTNPRKEVIQQQIANRSLKLSGNYDGMLGIVTNFNWSFNQEGGYDCSIKLLGLGSIVDSLRINLSYTMPGILFSQYQREQKRIRDYAAEIQALKERQAALDEKKKQGDALAQTRKDQGLDETPVPAAKNPSEIYTVVAARDYDPVSNPEQQVPFLNRISIFSNYQSRLTYTDADGKVQQTLNEVPDYYYKANKSPQVQQDEMNGLKYPSAGLYLNTIVGKRAKWELIPAGVSVANGGQRARINVADLNVNLYRYVSTGINPVPTFVSGIETLSLTSNREVNARSSLGLEKDQFGQTVPAAIPYLPSNEFFRPFGYALKAVNRVGLVKGSEVLDSSLKVRYDYAAEVRQKNITDTGQKIFYIDIEYRLGDGDTLTGVLTALDTWAKNGGAVSIIGLTTFEQTTGAVKKETFNDLLITAKLESLSIRGEIIFKFNNTAFIQELLPNIPPSKTTGQAAGAAASGDADGTINTASTAQTDPSDKFASSLHAMLTAVKSFMQDKAIKKGVARGVIKESIADITKVMYQDGILKDVFTPGPSIIKPNLFDVTAYAKKGFNSNLMVDPSIAATVPDVDFSKADGICTAYAIKYTQAESDASINYPIYVKLGYLMAFLNNMCLIYDSTTDEDRHPYVYLDFNPETNFCLTTPQHLSVDPFTCMIPFQGTEQDYLNIFPLELQKIITNPLKPSNNIVSGVVPAFKSANNQYQGRTMDILLNVDYLLSVVSQYTSTDATHAVYLKGFLDSVVTGINKSTGGMNLFRVSYRDDSNTVIIKDDQFVPPADGEQSIMVRSQYLQPGPNGRPKYGQLPIFGAQSLVRDMEFRTELSTKMASMIAISAQAETGSANSKDHTPLSYLNPNYVDAYKPKVGDATTGNQNTNSNQSNNTNQSAKDGQNANNDKDQAQQFNDHILNVYSGTSNSPIAKDKIDFAMNYYIERISKVKADNKITQSAPFIPANINLTIDGIAGIVMGNAFTIPEDRLPASLKGDDGQTKVGFIVVGLTHVLENNQWLTKIRGQMIKLRDNADYGAAQQIKAIQSTFTTAKVIGKTDLGFLNFTGGWQEIAFEYIKKNEGFLDRPKWDYNRDRAGYGSDNFVTADGQVLDVVATTVFTREDAARTLRYNIQGPYKNGVVNQLGQTYWDALTDPQKAALVSYTYNAGPGALRTWGIREAIRSNKSSAEVAALIERGPITAYDKRTGRTDTLEPLIRRRREEAQMYLS